MGHVGSLAGDEGLDGEGPGDAGEALEVDLSAGGLVDVDLVDRGPQEQLLCLHALGLADASGPNVTHDLRVVAHQIVGQLEVVLHLLLLLDPHVARLPDEADLHHVGQGEEAQGEAELLQEGEDERHALLVAPLHDASLLLRHFPLCFDTVRVESGGLSVYIGILVAPFLSVESEHSVKM